MDSDGDSVHHDSSIDLTANAEDDVIELEADEVQKTKSKGKRPRKLTSPVWGFFEKIAEKSVDGLQICKCKYCGAIFICDSKYGTGNLKRHINLVLGGILVILVR